MKKISRQTELPASPAEVFEIISHEGFQGDKAQQGTLPGSDASVSVDGDRVRIRTVRHLSAHGLPSIARSAVGDRLTIEEVHDWGPPAADGSRTGTFSMHVHGAPVTMTGTVALRPSGTGTLQTVDGELVAKVPFVGGKIEEAAAPALDEAITVEFDLIRARL
jgi:hypothetical protein